jgi:hypothetical protein
MQLFAYSWEEIKAAGLLVRRNINISRYPLKNLIILHINLSQTSKTSSKHILSLYNKTSFTMKVTAIFFTLMAAATVSASAISDPKVLDLCGAGYANDQRRTNSGCQASNGDRHFCGCDRTGVVCQRIHVQWLDHLS